MEKDHDQQPAARGLKPEAVPFEVEYRNTKTLRLMVYPPDGRVKVSAPLGTEPEFIRKFVASKIDWVIKQREKFRNQPAGTRPGQKTDLRNNSTVYVWGTGYKLELIERKGNPKFVIEDGFIKMYVRPDSTKTKRLEYLDRWYSRMLKETAGELIEKWESVTGIEVKKLYVRKMKSHWGSCNCTRQTIRLNSELAKRNPECLEYVIVHEMLHIIEKGHNRNFYRLLNKYIPEWKAIRKKMNSGI